MTVGSLFAGIGGFDLGLERAGMRIAWHSEIDPYACAVLRKHWPHVPNHGDIRNVRAGAVEPVDVLCGGFPCQDISNAGKRAGIDGERSGLWGEYARVIGELRPRYVIVENVSALLGRGIERVLGDLAALGFDAEWHCIPAAAVGAPHRRDRVWIVAYARSEQHEGASDADRRAPAAGLPETYPGADVADANVPRLAQRIMLAGSPGGTPSACAGQVLSLDSALPDADDEGEPRCAVHDGSRISLPESARSNKWWRAEPDVGRVANGVPSRVDRLRCLGNAIVPQIAEIIGRAILNA
jgi:DNA (cytosine-5)-methyltransferase 1